jgi:uncharacterized protein (TIGR03067 family)
MGADKPGKVKSSDHAAVQGTWKLSAGEANSKTLASSYVEQGKLIVSGDEYTVTLAGAGTVTGTEKLDATTEPKSIDITDDSGPNKGKACLGIYEIKDGVFRVAFAAPGKPRPTSFATQPDTGQWMHEWKRSK